MLPQDKSVKLADGAAGKFDELFRNYAEQLVKHGFADAVVRPGWEFNADWYPWAAKHDPESWVAYWRRIVTTMRSVPGAKFKFDWCAAGGWSAFRAEKVYPGDEYVDIIGLDFYNTLGASMGDVSPQQRWELRKKSPHGLDWHRSFAQSRNKPMSFPEWGTGKARDARGGEDDPYFVEQMAAWIKSNRVAYHNYWDYSAPILDSKLSDGRRPAAGAALIRAFGDMSKHVPAPVPAPAKNASAPRSGGAT
jgi:beta-mannanase